MGIFSLFSRIQGWSRKLGMFFLLMSLVFAWGWMGSWGFESQNEFPITQEWRFVLASYEGICGVTIVSVQPDPGGDDSVANTGANSFDHGAAGFRLYRIPHNITSGDDVYDVVYFGFHFPFWFAIGMSICLGAWLLLRKPQKKKTNQP